MTKPCPRCAAPLVDLRSQFKRICSGCKVEFEWRLDDGQKPLINSSRGDKKQ